MEYLFIYLLQVASNIADLLFFISSFFLIFLIAYIATSITKEYVTNDKYSNDDEKERITSINVFIKKFTITLGILLFILIIIPTKQTLLLMGGTYLGKKAVNAVVTDEKIKKVDTIINLQLDKYIKELQGKEVM